MSDYFMSFDSMDQMLEYLAEQRRIAKESIQDPHRALMDGKKHYWVSPRPDYGVNIYGYVMDIEELYQDGIEKYGLEEADYENNALKESLANGYLFGMAFSKLEPDGELGSTHVTRVMEISEAAFNLAKENEWP